MKVPRLNRPVDVPLLEQVREEYDLFISSAGFEDRTLAAIENVQGRTKFRKSLVNLYDVQEKNLMGMNMNNLSKIESILKPMSGSPPLVIKSSPSSASQFHSILTDNLRSDMNIMIDITSFTRLFLYALLHAVRTTNVRAHIVYSEPEDYTTNLSRGLEEIMIVPFFRGLPDQSKKILMIMFLGWEVRRAESVVAEFDPDQLVSVIERSMDPSRRRWNEVTKEYCRDLIEDSSEVIETPAFKPEITISRLEKLYSRTKRLYDLCILSIGPKIQCLAISEFATRHEDVQVLYAKPHEWTRDRSLNVKPITTGKGRSFLLHFPNSQ